MGWIVFFFDIGPGEEVIICTQFLEYTAPLRNLEYTAPIAR